MVKRVKDPQAPKKPPTAFFLWLKENRPRLQESNPKVSVTGIAKLAGEEWRNMKDKQKEEWQKKHDELRAEYVTKMKDYKKTA